MIEARVFLRSAEGDGNRNQAERAELRRLASSGSCARQALTDFEDKGLAVLDADGRHVKIPVPARDFEHQINTLRREIDNLRRGQACG